MTDRRRTFYTERDRRTFQYGAEDDALERPVRIVVDEEAASSRAGQIATLALVNMAARVHRRIRLDVPAAPLIARGLMPADDLRAAAVATALAITPVIDLLEGPPGKGDPMEVGVGIGARVPRDLDLFLSWHGGRGSLEIAATGIESCPPDSVFGAATAAVLGASALFRLVHDQPVHPTTFNPIELAAGVRAGTRDHRGPIDAGAVLVVGAGAVASAFAYWVREIGTSGLIWDFVDRDLVELHNTNRCMTMTAAHAGWPGGVQTDNPVHKADATAWAVGGQPNQQWYDEWQPAHQRRHDLVLLLANGRGVRSLVAHRGEPVLLHATTSANWTAELHRHVPGRDDCPACRLPDNTTIQMGCATGPIDVATPSSPDAALPFLSAAAGLLLAAAIAEMPSPAVFGDRFNHWQFDLTGADPVIQPRQHPPRDGCRHVQSVSIRRAVQLHDPCRWDHLDTDQE